MIRRVFAVQIKWLIKFALPCFAAAFGCAAACGAFSYTSLKIALSAAEWGFYILNAFTYIAPLGFIVCVAAGARYRYYQAAGVSERDAFIGKLLSLCVCVAAFILSETLVATAYDGVLFIGRDRLRNLVSQPCFLLSLHEHGLHRVLFAVSLAVTSGLIYFSYEILRVCARRTGGGVAAKTAVTVAVFLLIFFYHFAAIAPIQRFYGFDGSLLVSPDSVLPLFIDMFTVDSVKDHHLLAAPLLNAAFLLTEGLYVFTGVCLIKGLGRCKNEMPQA